MSYLSILLVVSNPEAVPIIGLLVHIIFKARNYTLYIYETYYTELLYFVIGTQVLMSPALSTWYHSTVIYIAMVSIPPPNCNRGT